MNYIYQVISTQPGPIPQATGEPTNAIFWESTVFVDH